MHDNQPRIAAIIPSFQRHADSEKYIDFDKLFQLFAGKYSYNMYDRQAAVLDKIARVYRNVNVSAFLQNICTSQLIPSLMELL